MKACSFPYAALLALTLGACVSPRGDFQRREIVVACDFDNPPFASLDERGVPRGRDVQMMRRLARELDRVLVWRRMPFEDLIGAVETYAVDAACATLGATPERDARVDFTRPYFRTALAVVVATAPGAPDSLAELSGGRVGAAPGTTSERAVRELLPDAELVPLGEDEAAERLARGELAALVMDAVPARRLAAARPDLALLTDALAPEEYAIAVAPGLDLVEELNALLERMERSGALAALDAELGLVPHAR